jgi:hypothetical protein
MFKALFILAIFLLTAGAAEAQSKSFQGSWVMDQTSSKGLPEYYSRIKSHKLSIQQDKTELKLAIAIDLGGSEPDRFDLRYQIDGPETKTETPVRTPKGLLMVPTVLSARSTGQNALHISIVREVPMGASPFKGVTTEEWELSKDGKTLNIHKVDDTPRGKLESQMVFRKE